jgi:hypothetical protein
MRLPWRAVLLAGAAFVLSRCARDEDVPVVEPPPPDRSIADATPGPAIDASTTPDVLAPLLPAKRTLFVGNSFTYFNELPASYRTLATAFDPKREPPVIDGVTYGGWTLTAHLADARGTGTYPRLSTILGPDAGVVSWSWVVLQEQSQIPSFDASNPTRQQSIASAVSLSDLAAAAGATTLLFMTWGYATSDYVSMQTKLETGYRDMAKAIATAGHAVKIAPIGPAFRIIYEREVMLGHDPLAAGSPFIQLYDADHIHPAAKGSYLGACVVTATIEDADPTTFTADIAGIDAATKLELQKVARDAVAAEKLRPPP